MLWIVLAIILNIINAYLVIFQKNDTSDKFLLPIISLIIIGLYALIYFSINYKTNVIEFTNPKFYIFGFIFFISILLTHYIIKLCPNPGYFGGFLAIELLLLLLYTIYYNNSTISYYGIFGVLLVIYGIILISVDNIKWS
jgi:hypothetical protein